MGCVAVFVQIVLGCVAIFVGRRDHTAQIVIRKGCTITKGVNFLEQSAHDIVSVGGKIIARHPESTVILHKMQDDCLLDSFFTPY